jgi:hypothetical protein
MVGTSYFEPLLDPSVPGKLNKVGAGLAITAGVVDLGFAVSNYSSGDINEGNYRTANAVANFASTKLGLAGGAVLGLGALHIDWQKQLAEMNIEQIDLDTQYQIFKNDLDTLKLGRDRLSPLEDEFNANCKQ